MNTTTETKNPETLEQEVNERRANLNQTLNAVEQKLSPNHLMEQTMDYVGQHGGDIVHSVSRSFKDNPLPLLLTGVGLAWLMSSQSRAGYQSSGSTHDAYRDRLTRWDEGGYRSGGQGSAYDRTNLPVNDRSPSYQPSYRSGVDTGAAEAGEHDDDKSYRASMQDTVGQLSNKAEQWKEELSAKLTDLKQGTEETAEDWQKRVVDASAEHSAMWEQRVHQANARLGAQARDQAQNARHFMQEQPLVVGALGIAAGALIGALLPSTRAEDRLIGDQASTVKETLKSHSDDVKEKVADKAEQMAEQASERISDKAQALREQGEARMDGTVSASDVDRDTAPA